MVYSSVVGDVGADTISMFPKARVEDFDMTKLIVPLRSSREKKILSTIALSTVVVMSTKYVCSVYT